MIDQKLKEAMAEPYETRSSRAPPRIRAPLGQSVRHDVNKGIWEFLGEHQALVPTFVEGLEKVRRAAPTGKVRLELDEGTLFVDCYEMASEALDDWYLSQPLDFRRHFNFPA